MNSQTEGRRSAGRPTREEAAAIDALILKGARDAFCQGGFSETSMDEVAQTAGASKLTIYRRYPSKEALLIAVVDEDIDQMRAMMADVVTPDGDPVDALHDMARKLYDFSTQPDSLCFVSFLMWEVVRNPTIRESFKDWTGSSARR